MKRNYRSFFIVASLLLIPFSSSVPMRATDTTAVQTSTQTSAQTSEQSAASSTDTLISALNITAETAIVMDGTTGQVLFEKNPHKPMNPASITKLLTALIAIESLTPEDTLTFSEEALTSIHSQTSRIGMKVGETITVNDALHGLLLMSANDVANGLAEKISGSTDSFVYRMNQRAADIGTLNSQFTNPHGLYDENHHTSAYDMALITKEVIKSEYFLSIMKDSLYQIPPTNKESEIRYLSQQHKMLNTKKDLRIYREDVIAGKVGFTTESAHTLVTVSQRDNRVVIVVIMKTDADHLYSDTNQLLDYGFDQYKPITINPSEYSQTVSIQDATGEKGTATVSLAEPIALLLPLNQEKATITFTPDLPESLTPDIAIGQVKGFVQLSNNNLPMGQYDLVITKITSLGDVSTEKEASSKKASTSETDNETSKKKGSFLIPVIVLLVVLLLGFFVFYKYLELKAKRARLARKRAYYQKIKKENS